MQFGVCHIPVVPLRSEPADPSEMISQVMFGEHFKVLEHRKKWSRIRLYLDNYEGWICNKQYVFINEETYDAIGAQQMCCTRHWCSEITLNGAHVKIPMGSSLPLIEHGKGSFGGLDYSYEGALGYDSGAFQKANIVTVAKELLHTPYLWGGKSPFGIDCSGFVQIVYKVNGVRLPRDAYQQAEIGEGLSFIEEAEPGDLAFFDNAEGKIIHVGIVLEDNYIIHASGGVRIDRLDHQGIFNADKNDYTHKMRLIARVI